jgi:peptidoglycan/xylan/chitin deacetylase (PgdA/CDA1 family)
MIYRNDDVAFGCDVSKYRAVQEVFESFGIKEMYSVVPFGKNIYVPRAHILPRNVLENTVGNIPVWEDKEVDGFIKESLAKGHSISLHGWIHAQITNYSFSEILENLTKAKNALEEHYGVKIKHFIPPFNTLDSNGIRACDKLGMEYWGYNGNQLEILVETGEKLRKLDYCWYHAWRFFEGQLTLNKLKDYLCQQQQNSQLWF